MPRTLRAVDLFCGAGGSSTGAMQAGVEVVLAVNHWHVAIQSHRANHPNTRHICARIDDIDPRHDNLLPFDILMASPECTHHSIARGGMPVDDQKRATPWHVCAWAEARKPKWIVVENVREFRDWGPIHNGRPIKSRKGETFEAWLNALRALGYTVEHRILNSADFGEATKRLRLFIVARRGTNAKIPWPEPTHAGKWRAASEIIDWERPCPSIFHRKRPLADKTLLRIESGLHKFVGPQAEPFMVHLRGTSKTADLGKPSPTITSGGGHLALVSPFQFKAMGRNPGATKSIDEPLPTIVAARENHSIVVPYLVPNFGERDGQSPRSHAVGEPLPAVTSHGAGQLVMPFLASTAHAGTTGRGTYVHSADEPLRTVTSRAEHAVVAPFLSHFHNGPDGADRNSSPGRPLPTLDTQPRHALVAPYLVDVNHGNDHKSGSRIYPTGEPLRTVTTKRGQSLVLPFLTEYYGTGDARSIEEPLSTVTTKHRHGLAMVKLIETMESLGVVDVGFRMLDVDELAAAQGFSSDYQLYGTKAEQIKQVGNAVPPGFMRAICNAIRDAA